MLGNSKVNMAISLILAIILWLYVVGEMNPVTKKTYRDIPVTLINEQTLNDNDLAVRHVSDEKMRITVSGKRDAINKMSKTDVTATCDLSNAAEGNNKLSIDVKIPENMDIENLSLDYVTVTVEDYVTEEKKIKVFYSDDLREDEEPETVKVSPKKVNVSGARSLVEKVSYVKTEVSTDDVTEDLSSTTSDLTAVNRNGSPVSRVTLSETSCIVTTRIRATSEE